MRGYPPAQEMKQIVGITAQRGIGHATDSLLVQISIDPLHFPAGLSVAVKKGAILAPLAPGGPLPSRMSLSFLLGGVVQNGPERSRARRYWARRSGPLTARTVLGDWSKKERLSEELAKGGPKKWPLCLAPLTAGLLDHAKRTVGVAQPTLVSYTVFHRQASSNRR
jgi:hypothetical protein